MKSYIIKADEDKSIIEKKLLELGVNDFRSLKNLPFVIFKSNTAQYTLAKRIFGSVFESEKFEGASTQVVDPHTGNWGLTYIDQVSTNLTGLYHYNRTGSKVDVIVLDTGIMQNHTEFGGRVVNMFDYRTKLKPTDPNYITSSDPSYCRDDHGHGTHVASVIGGRTFGVAKGVKLFSSKVFSKELFSNTEWILLALDEISSFHASKLPVDSATFRPTVINMSFVSTSRANQVLDQAIHGMISAGITCVAAAGNHGTQAVNYTPARVANCITVGAITKASTYYDSTSYASSDIATLSGSGPSNYGLAVDILAPGTEINGAWVSHNKEENSNFRKMNGTSVSAAFVSGIAALGLDRTPEAQPSVIKDFIIRTCIEQKIKRVRHDTPNKCLRSVFTPRSLYWDTRVDPIEIPLAEQAGVYIADNVVIQNTETSLIYFKFEARRVEYDAEVFDVSYSYATETDKLILEALGLTLANNGILRGNTPYINDIISKLDDLGPAVTYTYLQRNEIEDGYFSIDVKGILDVTLSLIAYDDDSVVSQNFIIRIFQLNENPDWYLNDNVININELYPNARLEVENTVEIDLKSIVSDNDGDELTFTLLNGFLPNGLSLSNDGLIFGTIATTGSIEEFRTFKFSTRVTDGAVNIDKQFTMTIRQKPESNTPPIFITPGVYY